MWTARFLGYDRDSTLTYQITILQKILRGEAPHKRKQDVYEVLVLKNETKSTLYRAYSQFCGLREKFKKKRMLRGKKERVKFGDSVEALQVFMDFVVDNEQTKRDKDLYLFLEAYQLGDKTE